ncbi:MAG: VCBS repeat-containing protein [Bacteroidota bacterium]
MGACHSSVDSSGAGSDIPAEVQAHCGGCHLVPDPELLDQTTWEDHVLPNMALIMGLEGEEALVGVVDSPVIKSLRTKGLFPSLPRIDQQTWKSIQAYFLTRAPEHLSEEKELVVQIDSAWELHSPPLRLSPPSTSILSLTRNGQIWVGDAHTKSLQVLGANMKLQGVANVGGPPVDIQQIGGMAYVLVMGDFAPNDLESGYLMGLPLDGKTPPEKLITSLRRPVSMVVGDFNQDQIGDWVIAEYGKWLGRTRIWWGQKDGRYKPELLSDRQGPAKILKVDWDGDTDQDLLMLFGQGEEGIYWYENQGKGEFKERLLKSFPPSYGSVEIGLFDGENDGRPDLWYVAGDMADYPPTFKPYHGAYFFHHKPDHQLNQESFIPMRGAYGMTWGDWDGDRIKDAAIISFFPSFDIEDPANFYLLYRTGPYDFEVKGVPFPLSMGRWLRIYSGDMDQDGDRDIALASLAFGVAGDSLQWVNRWTRAGIPFVWLENK